MADVLQKVLDIGTGTGELPPLADIIPDSVLITLTRLMGNVTKPVRTDHSRYNTNTSIAIWRMNTPTVKSLGRTYLQFSLRGVLPT